MLNRLRALFKKGRDDPLSTLRTATQWTQSLAMGNVHSAQEAIVHKLGEFNRRKPGLSAENVQIIIHLDDHAQELQKTLCNQYLRNPRMSKIMESKLWNMIYAFHWEVTRAYHGFIMEYVSGPGGRKLETVMPTITARALEGFGNIFKWRNIRYELPDERLWLRLHNLYRVAEFEHMQDRPLETHPGETPTTCSRLYIGTLMLSTLNIDTMYPRQIALVGEWLKTWTEDIRLDSTLNAAHHQFYVDTTHGGGLRRLRSSTGKESYCYISTHTVERRILHTISELKNGVSPVSLGLTEDCRLPEAFDLLEHLLRQWASEYERNQRRAERNRVKRRLSIVRSLNDLGHMLSMERRTEEPLPEIAPDKWEVQVYKMGGIGNFRPSKAQEAHEKSEYWLAENESNLGYCAHMEAAPDDWLQLDQIVGIRADGGWRPGVIRRIRRLPEELQEVGLELLPGTAHSLSLRSRHRDAKSGYLVNGVDSMAVSTTVPAILLEPEPGMNEEESLILDSAHYSKGRVFEFSLNGEEKTVQLDAVLDKGPAWVRAKFTRAQ